MIGRRTDELVVKRRKVYANYHKKCSEFVTGNGSVAAPYRCSCGIWHYDHKTYKRVLHPYKKEDQ